jgi:hypothetical protein
MSNTERNRGARRPAARLLEKGVLFEPGNLRERGEYDIINAD